MESASVSTAGVLSAPVAYDTVSDGVKYIRWKHSEEEITGTNVSSERLFDNLPADQALAKRYPELSRPRMLVTACTSDKTSSICWHESTEIDCSRSKILMLCDEYGRNDKLTEIEKNQFKLLGEMFKKLFVYEIPDELPDFTIVRTVLKLKKDAFTDLGCRDCRQVLEQNGHLAMVEHLNINYRLAMFYCPVSTGVAEELAKALLGDKHELILEVGSGLGWWAQSLAEASGYQLEIIATDNHSGLKNHALKMAQDEKSHRKTIVEGAQLPSIKSDKKIHFRFSDNSGDMGRIDWTVETTAVENIEELSATEAVTRFPDPTMMLVTCPSDINVLQAMINFSTRHPVLWINRCSIAEFGERFQQSLTYEHISNPNLTGVHLTLPDSSKPATIEWVQHIKPVS